MKTYIQPQLTVFTLEAELLALSAHNHKSTAPALAPERFANEDLWDEDC